MKRISPYFNLATKIMLTLSVTGVNYNQGTMVTMKRISLFMILAFGLYVITMNEPQRREWNRFWCIKTVDTKAQGKSFIEKIYRFDHIPDNLRPFLSPDNQIKYKIRKKAFFNPYSPSQYEYVFQ
ncbi:MAG: hypothetical protein ABIG31_06270 [Candidatus Omnitrophota bacterium]